MFKTNPPTQLDGPASKGRDSMEWFLDGLAEALAGRLEKRIGVRARLLDSDATARYLGLSEDAVRDLTAQGKLTPVRPTRKLQFDIRDLDAFIESLKTDGR